MAKLQGNFTQVPNSLLRTAGMFEDPFDFMIYMLLYSYSYGFGRDTANMSQSQIEEFAGVSKNRVKRSLDRLIKQGWIKLASEYERSRISRKWRVLVPEGRNPGPKKSKITVSTVNSVQNGQCPQQTPTVSAMDPVTVSKMDTFRRKGPKYNFQKNSLSGVSGNFAEYFDGLKPQKKRESELRAFEGLRKDFDEGEIADCLDHLQSNGLSGGVACHSPMNFLARAMGDVLAVVKSNQEAQRKTVENIAMLEFQKQHGAALAMQEGFEWREKVRAFVGAFPDPLVQEEVVVGLCRQNRYYATKGQAARTFAIGAWARSNRKTAEKTG